MKVNENKLEKKYLLLYTFRYGLFLMLYSHDYKWFQTVEEMKEYLEECEKAEQMCIDNYTAYYIESFREINLD